MRDPRDILSGTMISGLLRSRAGRFLLVTTLAALALSLVEHAKSGSAAGAGSPVWGIAAGLELASVSTYWMGKRTCPVPRRRGGTGA